MNMAAIEQTKLLANAFDRASTSCFTVGIATPLVGYGYNVAVLGTTSAWQIVTSLLTWSLLAIALHYLARRTLRRLR
ncbi:hypothetical protein [Rhizobium sp. SAFR-030]|uniref:hypothetical protein n=1 Tax=Rhizobium sp. SAFR-030 TaxID=3387277 RepID=UPI003F7E561A